MIFHFFSYYFQLYTPTCTFIFIRITHVQSEIDLINVGFSVQKSSKDRYYCERLYWKSIVLNKKQFRAYRTRQLNYLQKQEKKTSKAKNTNKMLNKVIKIHYNHFKRKLRRKN